MGVYRFEIENMIETEYTTKFEELGWYTTKTIAFDDVRKMKFMRGLRFDVVKKLIVEIWDQGSTQMPFKE